MRTFLFFILFFVISLTQAQEKSLFDQATQHYADENYQEAIQDYQKIISSGKTSPEVYFNLGNAYYKIDSIAPSIFYYNKALQLSPNDKDVKNNLLFAQERTVDVIEAKTKTGLSRFVDNLISTLHYNSWAILAICASILFFIFGVWYYFTAKIFRKRLLFSISILVLVIAVLSVIFAYKQFEIQKDKKFAIVFAQEVEVHAEPNHNSSSVFTLHEGTKIKVLDDFNGYSKIELPNELQGWITEEAIKKLQ